MNRAAIIVVLSVACGGSDEPAWALQHGTVRALADGIEGYQVWEFYGRKWEKKRSEKQHICSVVQALEGSAADDVLDGCASCGQVFAVSLAEIETDCTGDTGTEPGFLALTHMAIGPSPEELRDDDPHPGDSLGWYASWDATTVDLLGWAWNEAIDQGESPEAEGWVEGETYVLWPGFAWEL